MRTYLDTLAYDGVRSPDGSIAPDDLAAPDAWAPLGHAFDSSALLLLNPLPITPDATVNGTAGNDFIHVAGDGHALVPGFADMHTATNSADTINPGAGNDIVYAGGGNDTITGDQDNGTIALYGEAGDDTISLFVTTLPVGTDHDIVLTVDGGDGNDTVTVSTPDGVHSIITPGVNFTGGAGTDTLELGPNMVVAGTGAFNAATTGFEQLQFLRYGALTGDTANNRIDISGFTILAPNGFDAELNGAYGDDVLIGTGQAANSIHGGDGNDTITGGANTDYLYGDAGDDVLKPLGGASNRADGGTGNDTAVLTGNMADYTFTKTDSDSFYVVDSHGNECDMDSIETVRFADQTVLVSNIDFSTVWTGTAGDDIIDGNAGNDTINGLAGNDRLSGLDGDDTLNGGDGNDILDGGYGTNILNGGAGNDTMQGDGPLDIAVFSGKFADYTILQLSEYLYQISSAEDGVDLVNFIGTFQFSDQTVLASALGTTNQTLTGTSGGDTLTGAFGNDTINGLDGNDLLSGMDGDDTIDGGAGNDIIDTGTGNDTAKGGDGDDTIFAGNGGTKTLDGGAGNDTIRLGEGGFGGPPTVISTALTGGTGTDTLWFDGNATFLATSFSAVSSSLEQIFVGQTSANGTIYTPDSGVIYDFSGFTVVNPFSTPTLIGVSVMGGAGNDTITGTAQGDTLNGGAGDDKLNGGDGADILIDGLGTNTLHGNGGSDTLYGGAGITEHLYGDAGDDSIVTQGAGTHVLDGGDGNDTMNINAIGAGANSYTITGGTGDDTIWIAGTSSFSVDMGDGNDTLTVLGAKISMSQVIGGAGTDTLHFEGLITLTDSTFAVGSGGFEQIQSEGNSSIAIAATNANYDFSGFTLIGDYGVQVGGATGNNHITGTALGDTISGGGGANVLSGLGGDDTLSGGNAGSTSTLNGGDGNDTLIVGNGTETLNGGAGNDTLGNHFATGSGSYTINGNAGDDVTNATAGTYVSIDGGGGNDTLNLGGASSFIIASSVIHDSSGTDTLHIMGAVEITGSVFSAATSGFEKLQVDSGGPYTAGIVGDASDNVLDFSGFTMVGAFPLVAVGGGGNDTITGTSSGDILSGDIGNDTVNGGGGNDIIVADAGTDTLNGGSGFDTAAYGNATSTVTVSLLVATAQNVGGGMGSDTLVSIEDLAGSQFNDVLTGDGNSNILTGGAGNDTLNGGDGSDFASYSGAISGVTVSLAIATAQAVGGGLGSDTLISIENLFGSDYNDTLTGNGADNVLQGGLGDDHLDGQGGNDTVSYADALSGVTVSLAVTTGQNVGGGEGTDTFVSIENLEGSLFDDVLTGSNGANTISGLDGNDTIDLTAGGNDTAQGGAGNDLIVMGAALTAADTIDGGAGNDTVKLNGDYSAGLTFGASTMINVETLQLNAGHSYTITVSPGTVNGGAILTVNANSLAAANTLTFNGQPATTGAFILLGGAGNDVLTGGSGNDVFTGGLGADHLTGGVGSDHFAYKTAAESTGVHFDTITGFDAPTDAIDLTFLPDHFNAAVTGVALHAASFDADLAAALNASHLGTHHAVLVTAGAGDYTGDTFLVVDLNKVAGYQAGADLVIMLDHPTNMGSFGAADFI